MKDDEKKTKKFMKFNCSKCNSKLSVDARLDKIFCQYCGAKYLIEHSIDSNDELHAAVKYLKEDKTVNQSVGKSITDSAGKSVHTLSELWRERKQKKIVEEKRRQEEEKRRQEEERMWQEAEKKRKKERRKKILNQILNRKYLKRNLWILGVSLIVILVLGSMVELPEPPDHTGEASAPSGSIHQEGRNYSEVIDDFEEKGFVNIKTEKIDDLLFGLFTKDGEVESVMIDSSEDYSPGTWYPNDVEVIIYYHTFIDVDENETSYDDSKDEEISLSEEQSSDGFSQESDQVVLIEETKSTEDMKLTEDKTEELPEELTEETSSEIATITIYNNAEFADLMKITDPSDPSAKAFADAHKGENVEFDGCVGFMMNHKDFKTRFDILLCGGDYYAERLYGAFFSFIDVNFYDMNVSGSSTVAEKMDFHIIGTIKEYNDEGNFIELDPVSMQYRE